MIDLPGIDAPVKKDAELTYQKIADEETSAVICVLKPAAAGDVTKEETELLEIIRENPGIRDRVFYVFNRIDETWYNTQLVNEFNRYCTSGKLSAKKFRISVNSYETPNENYVRILAEQGPPLIDQLIEDSGIEEFSAAITHYLTKEKRPQLFANLADDLQPLCIGLCKHYLNIYWELDSQPREIETMKSRELEQLNQQLQQVGEAFYQHLEEEVNQVVTNRCQEFESDFDKLQSRMVRRLDELLDTFSVREAYERATINHPRNATAPLLAVLVEALYSIANQLEDILVESCREVAAGFFQGLVKRIRKAEYYGDLYRLLGDDGGIEQRLKSIEKEVMLALESSARSECDRYVRESPRFYDEGTFSIYQFRQTLLQTSEGYDAESIIDAEPAIRQLLKLDFEPKVSATVRRNFRQVINQTIKTQLLPAAEQQQEDILSNYAQARAFLGQTLDKEAAERIANNERLRQEVAEKIDTYNRAVEGINSCLRSLQLDRYKLPIVAETELVTVSEDS